MAARITKVKPHRAWLDSLWLVAACAAAPAAKRHELHHRGSCPAEREDGAYDLDATQADARRGVHATTFAAASGTLQLCGLAGELAWLVRATCADGSHPFATPEAAHAARTGSGMAPGLTCDKPVDVYTVRCPERTYELRFDRYQCGPGEELFR